MEDEITQGEARDFLATIEELEKDDVRPDDGDAGLFRSDAVRNALAVIAEIKGMLRSVVELEELEVWRATADQNVWN